MSVRRYEAGDAAEVQADPFMGQRGTVLERVVDDDAVPERVVYLVQFSNDEPARWFVAGRFRRARSRGGARG